jgi:hypothetical protein
METEKNWNEKILALTLQIKDTHPELSKYIEEMPVTLPTETDPVINLKNLMNYYASLQALLSRYIKEGHPEKAK